MKQDFLRAKEQYLEAIGVEADCVEALYNLAFVNKKLNMFVEALQALEKLQTIISHVPEVIFQIANIHELMGNIKQALKWYQVHKTLPSIINRFQHQKFRLTVAYLLDWEPSVLEKKMKTRHYTISRSHTDICQPIQKPFHGLGFTTLKMIFMNALVISSNGLLKYNLKKYNFFN